MPRRGEPDPTGRLDYGTTAPCTECHNPTNRFLIMSGQPMHQLCEEILETRTYQQRRIDLARQRKATRA